MLYINGLLPPAKCVIYKWMQGKDIHAIAGSWVISNIYHVSCNKIPYWNLGDSLRYGSWKGKPSQKCSLAKCSCPPPPPPQWTQWGFYSPLALSLRLYQLHTCTFLLSIVVWNNKTYLYNCVCWYPECNQSYKNTESFPLCSYTCVHIPHWMIHTRSCL